MLSGPQILDVLSCEAALIATRWPHTLWLPKAHIKSNIPPKFDWNWNEKIQEQCDMAPGVLLLLTRSLRQSAIRNIRYACVAAGYFTGLETDIISQQPSVWNESAAILSTCQSNHHQGAPSSMRNATVFKLLSKRYRKVMCFSFPPHPNFTFHLDISLFACNSCSPPPVPLPEPRPVHPFIRHSAVLRRAGRSRAGWTRGLGEVTTPCCLLASCLLDDATVHLQGKWVLACGNLSFVRIAACFSCRHFAENL